MCGRFNQGDAERARRSHPQQDARVLDRESHDAWLDPEADLGLIHSLLAPAPEASLRRWPVSTAVNNVDADGPALLRPIEMMPTFGLA